MSAPANAAKPYSCDCGPRGILSHDAECDRRWREGKPASPNLRASGSNPERSTKCSVGIAEPNTVFRWEAGTRSPSAVDFLKLCKLLHIDPRKLLPPDVGGASLETEQA